VSGFDLTSADECWSLFLSQRLFEGPSLNAIIRNRVKSSYWMSILYYLVSDCYGRLRFRMGHIDTSSGTIHSTFEPGESVRYIEEVYRDYLRYCGVARFHGRVAEVGPGDNCGVGLLFRRDGCTQIDLVDRFYSRRNMAAQAAIYSALIDAHPGMAAAIGEVDLQDERSFRFLTRHYGEEASAERFFQANRGFDFIVSRAVFEHLYDPILALHRMVEALNPGGFLLHKVDLRDHGMFSGAHHELKFLEIRRWLYPWLTVGSGRPNRVLVHAYRAGLAPMPVDVQLLVTRLVGVGDIVPHLPYEAIAAELRARSIARVQSVRKQLAACFADVSDADLSISGLFLVARRLP
jgi:SAM-dependent methyltransferase